MDALLITLLITAPIIAIGTLLYLWRNRAITAADRRRRGALIAVVVFAAIGGLSVFRWSSQRESWQSLVFTLLTVAVVLASPLSELVRASRRK